MKTRQILTAMIVMAGFGAHAQVAVGTANPQGAFHVDGASDNPITGIPSTAEQANDFVVTTEGKVGIGTIMPNAKLDIRQNPASTENPGTGFLGLGTTSLSAPLAGAGALRYSTASGGILQYGNGVVWNTLSSSVQKSIVVAKKTSTQSFVTEASTSQAVTNWNEITDVNNNFNPSTGVFTCPRDGNYTISFSFNFSSGQINGGSQVEAALVSSLGSTNERKSVVAFPAAGTSQAGASISFTMRLTQGETIRPAIWHSTGYTKSLRVGTDGADGFVSFSVAEL